MALDAYSPCPCGSGKKFKWCCQPIHVDIDKAFHQEAEGQHEAALRLMDQVVADHPANPEAWGRKAQLLYENNKVEEAEAALQKALEINPKYPFGHLLRGMFRLNEGEIPGAVHLLRRAAELYAPEARDILAQVYAMIGENELKLNRPVAARAALKIAMHLQPNEDLLKNFDLIFGEKSHLPAAARREYRFQSPTGAASSGPREAWNRALPGADTGRLPDAARAFEQLTSDQPNDAAAWYNLGLARAWLGDNAGALKALDFYVTLEPDEGRAGAAWSLGEVLRCGPGMEEEASFLEHSALFQIRNIQSVSALLQDLERQRRLVGVQANQEQEFLTGLILENVPTLTGALAAAQLPKLGAYFLLIGDRFRLWNTSADALSTLRQELQRQAGPGLSEPHLGQGPPAFTDILTEALCFPVHVTDKEEARRRVVEQMQRFFEETWIQRPLRSLNLIPPVDAAGHGNLRKKLVGVIQFLEDCAVGGQVQAYDFNRLRCKLGLLQEASAAATPGAPAPLDIGAMSTAELAGLKTEELTDEQLEHAYQASLKLDAREVAGRFAESLVARPPRPERPDRYPWYAYLVQLALGSGDTDEALSHLNAGEKADCEQNEGRRRNDYELRRGQIHAKRGETDEAANVFERLIERAPGEMRYTSTAAETMLSANQGARALQFAERGLAKARERNDRDSEEHFKELVAAARKKV